MEGVYYKRILDSLEKAKAENKNEANVVLAGTLAEDIVFVRVHENFEDLCVFVLESKYTPRTDIDRLWVYNVPNGEFYERFMSEVADSLPSTRGWVKSEILAKYLADFSRTPDDCSEETLDRLVELVISQYVFGYVCKFVFDKYSMFCDLVRRRYSKGDRLWLLKKSNGRREQIVQKIINEVKVGDVLQCSKNGGTFTIKTVSSQEIGYRYAQGDWAGSFYLRFCDNFDEDGRFKPSERANGDFFASLADRCGMKIIEDCGSFRVFY